MKKILLLVALMIGANVSAQSMYKTFNAGKYAKALTEKIVNALDIQDNALQSDIQNQAYIYAQSIKKHILVAEKEGATQGKTLEEVIKYVKGEYKLNDRFIAGLKRFLKPDELEKVNDLL